MNDTHTLYYLSYNYFKLTNKRQTSDHFDAPFYYFPYFLLNSTSEMIADVQRPGKCFEPV